MQKGLALLSAGLDSTVALAMARKSGISISIAITFDYGQKAAPKELSQAQKLADHWGIEQRAVKLGQLSEWMTSSTLMKNGPPLPQLSLKDLDNPLITEKSARAVWVPNRNGVFLEIAAGFAEQLKLDVVVVGFNREEAETFPDNSKPYLDAINRALEYSTSNHVKVISPTIDLDKTSILKEALQLNIPLSSLWSCYEAGDQMCGTCESCMRLKRALKNNEVDFHELFTNQTF